jgi:23S rRNA (uracil1939-C5)-methyltransferase
MRNIHQKLGSQNPALLGSVLNIKTSRDNFIWGPLFKSLCGSKAIATELGQYKFNLDISAFFQINAPQAERIFSSVRDELKKSDVSSVLELYSGVGSLTAYIAGVAEHVDAVEEWRPAARLMEENMAQNGLGNVKIFTESAESFMSDPENLKKGKYGAIVLDPPRTGLLDAVIAGISRISPEKIIYISCNPATLARDAAKICEGGKYEIESLTACDMFPQTSHVESLCVLRSVNVRTCKR